MECHVCGRQLYLFVPTKHQEWCKYYKKATKPGTKVEKTSPGITLTIPHPEGWDI